MQEAIVKPPEEGQTQASPPIFSRSMLLRLILPLVVEQFLAVLIGMADTFMVSSVGEAAVSGISLVDSVNLLFIQIFSALATGGAVVAAHYLGKKEPEKACRSAKQLLITILFFSLILMAVCLIFKRQIISLIFGSIEADVMENAQTYFWLSAVSYPFLAIYNACAALYRSMNNSRVSMMTSILMNVVNIGGNALLIYVCKWGVAGAAFSSLVSRFLAAAVMLVLIQRKSNPIRLIGWKLKLDFSMINRILKIGIPNGVENGMFQIGKLLVQSLIATLGTSAIAANAIAGSVSAFANIPGGAINLAMITVVGQCMGAGETGQAAAYTKKLLFAVYAVVFGVCAVLFFAAEPILKLVNLTDSATKSALELLRLFAIASTLIWAPAFTTPSALRAAGDAKFTMIVSMISMLVFRIGFSYLLCKALSWGLQGIWVAMYIDWLIRAVIFTIRFKLGKWKCKHVI